MDGAPFADITDDGRQCGAKGRVSFSCGGRKQIVSATARRVASIGGNVWLTNGVLPGTVVLQVRAESSAVPDLLWFDAGMIAAKAERPY
jgi:hypothetical protein